MKKLSLEEIKNLIDGDPNVLIDEMSKYGIDFSGLDKNIAKNIVKERFSLTEDQFDAVDFVFWISYYIEKEAESLIIEPEVLMGARKQAMESIISKLHFGNKIKIIEELYTSKNDLFVKLMRQIQDLRNDVAHGRFDNLKYGGYSLSDNRGRLKLVANIRDSLLKKTI